jgi:Fe-S cluster assembly ATPase SufC
MALLEVKNLHVEVDGKKILNGLDLSVEKGSLQAMHERWFERGAEWPFLK